jgi:hypothetical protein
MSLIKRQLTASDEEVYVESYIDSDYEYQQWLMTKTNDLGSDLTLDSSPETPAEADHKF